MDRRTGTLVGMGIGLFVALMLFGVSRLLRRDNTENLLRAQALPVSESTTLPEAAVIPTAPPESAPPSPSDSLLQRLSPTSETIDTTALGEDISEIFRTP